MRTMKTFGGLRLTPDQVISLAVHRIVEATVNDALRGKTTNPRRLAQGIASQCKTREAREKMYAGIVSDRQFKVATFIA